MELNKSLWFSDSGKFNGAFGIAEHDYFSTDRMPQFDDLQKRAFCHQQLMKIHLTGKFLKEITDN